VAGRKFHNVPRGSRHRHGLLRRPGQADPARDLKRDGTNPSRCLAKVGGVLRGRRVEDPMRLTKDVRAALTAGHLAHLVTLDPDGSPQVTVVWVAMEGDEIVAGHLGVWRKLANMRRDPRVVLSIETGGHAPNGLAEYLGRPRHGPYHRRWRPRTAPTPGSRVPRSRREVPSHGEPATRLYHHDHTGACRRGRTLAELVAPATGGFSDRSATYPVLRAMHYRAAHARRLPSGPTAAGSGRTTTCSAASAWRRASSTSAGSRPRAKTNPR
jgi:hypothetical protein